MMEAEYLKNVIGMLEEEKRARFGDQALMKIKGELLKEPRQALDEAYNRIVLEFNVLPSPAKFLALVKEEGNKAREAERQKHLSAQRAAAEKSEQERKAREYEEGSVLTRRYEGRGIMKEWQELMDLVLAVPKVPWPVIIAKGREFDAKFPGLGFDVLADDWEKEHC
jgi:hypothetical protein